LFAKTVNEIWKTNDEGARIFDNKAILDCYENKKLALVIKGVSWSNFTEYMRKKIKSLFLEIVIAEDSPSKRAEIVNYHLQTLLQQYKTSV
jgi:hypothetical protein